MQELFDVAVVGHAVQLQERAQVGGAAEVLEPLLDAAIASASAALIWSKHPNWTNNQVLRVMLNTASRPKSGKDRTDYLGYGAVRPRIALTNPGDPGPADKYPLPDLTAAGSNSPSSDASESTGTGAPAKDDGSAAAASVHKEDGTSWVALGIGGAVLLGAAIAVAAVARRRRPGPGVV